MPDYFLRHVLLLCCGLVVALPVMAEDEPGVWRLQVEPREGVLRSNLDRLQLSVQRVSSREAYDVTRETTYEVLTPQTVAVHAGGQVRPLANGEGRVRLRQGDLAAEITLSVTGIEPVARARFQTDVVPILSRAGCNSGACHAAQYGKGGLKLSLLGFAPEQDYPALVRERGQRRVCLVTPRDSLILQKATRGVAHGGGRRFRADSHEYDVLLSWLRGGAPGPRKEAPELVDLAVTPASRVYRLDQAQQLRVVARYSDGEERDVTHLAMYDSMSTAVASVGEDGHVRAVGRGQTHVMVRFCGQAKISMVIVPFRDDVDLSGFEPHNFIDRLVKQRWQQLGLAPSPPCSDEEFLRRAFLDAIGTLPAADRVREFLASTATDKRARLVDELLGLTGDPARDVFVDEWSAYWTLKWGDLIRNNRNKLGDGGMWALFNWMRAALRENRPADRFVRELITAQGSVFESGPANFYKITTKPDELAEATAQNFLGVRLQCAKCHHHPFEVYSQADYYGLAAFFTRVGTKASTDFGALGGDTVVLVKASGSLRHPRTGQTMQPTPLLGKPLDSAAHRDLRRPLAEWLTSPDNKLFARNTVNRFWGYLMGSGLVEPIDDMRATNPPSNPELLEALAADFVQHEFDLRHLMRTIMTSRVYQLSSRPTPDNVGNERFYTHYNVKRLPAEVLLDAINFATGTEDKFSGIPAGTRAIELPDPNYASYFLDVMGRPQRVITCECERTSAPNLAQVLHVANGEVLSRKVADKNGRLARLLADSKPEAEIIEELYLCTVSRPPDKLEIVRCQKIMADSPSTREGLEDLLWALCNSREFLFNH